MLLDNAAKYGAAWVELVVRDRRHFRWDAPHPTLEEDDVVSAVYYCVPQESLLDALVPMIVHDSLVEFAESRGRNVEVGGGTTRGTFELPTASGTPYTVKLMVERETSGLAKRLTLQIREPNLDDTLDPTAAVARPEGPRPTELDPHPRVKATRPT
jgi:hypothetical protein